MHHIPKPIQTSKQLTQRQRNNLLRGDGAGLRLTGRAASRIDDHKTERDIGFQAFGGGEILRLLLFAEVNEFFYRLFMDEAGNVMEGATGSRDKIITLRIERDSAD